MNLRQLLALPLAFAMAWVVAYPFSIRLISYRWVRALNDLNSVAGDIKNRFIPHPSFTVDSLQRWTEGKTLQTDPPELQGTSVALLDPWGNPFQVVERSSHNGRRQFAVYSLGRDGMSQTNGNDPDDINSWSEDPVAYYQREAQAESQLYRLRCTIPLVCCLYAPMFYLLRTKTKQNNPMNPSGGSSVC